LAILPRRSGAVKARRRRRASRASHLLSGHAAAHRTATV